MHFSVCSTVSPSQNDSVLPLLGTCKFVSFSWPFERNWPTLPMQCLEGSKTWRVRTPEESILISWFLMIHLHIEGQIYECAHACKPLRVTSNIFFDCSFIILFVSGNSLKLRACRFGQSSSFLRGSLFLLPTGRIPGCSLAYSCISVGSVDLVFFTAWQVL